MVDKEVPTLWLVDVSSGQQRPLVGGRGSHSSPRWSPDGKRIAYVSSNGESSPQLYVLWLDSGTSVQVTGLPDGPGNLAWSPDGRPVAYTMRVPGAGMKAGSQPDNKPAGGEENGRRLGGKEGVSRGRV